MNPIISKEDLDEPQYRLGSSEYISFIANNSNMDWNTVCDFIYEKGYLSHDEMEISANFTETPNIDRINDHGVDYEYEFYLAHPFLIDRGVCFYFDS